MNCIQEAGVTLNAQKCEYGKTTIKCLGNLINETGIQAVPNKTRAIREMQAQTTVTGLHHFLGMVNQLGKFTLHLTDITQPLRVLLSKGNTWVWGPEKSNAFNRLKEELSITTMLALYDLQTPIKLSADDSSNGLRAMLLQLLREGWKPVA